MRAVIVCALPALAAILQALHGPALDVASVALLQHEVWAASRPPKGDMRTPGPWSLAAAERRRAQAELQNARVARDS